MVAYTLFALAFIQAICVIVFVPGSKAMRRAFHFAGIVTMQLALGIVTLLLVVPLWAALLHQAFAMVVLGFAVANLQGLCNPSPEARMASPSSGRID